MNDDMQAEQDLYILSAAKEMSPARMAQAKALAEQKAAEYAQMAKDIPSPPESVTKGYRVVG